jgi:hypothetical protein
LELGGCVAVWRKVAAHNDGEQANELLLETVTKGALV